MINIRLAKEKDINRLKQLIDENISVDYFTEDAIKSIINENNHYIFVNTDENDIPNGLIYCTVDTLKNACDIAYIPQDIESLAKYSKDMKVCLYKTTCTAKEARKAGILSSFMKEMDAATSKLDFDMNIVVALIHPGDVIPVHNILTDNGFVKIERIEHPWIKIKSYCSYCKSEYCKCDGMLYIKER